MQGEVFEKKHKCQTRINGLTGIGNDSASKQLLMRSLLGICLLHSPYTLGLKMRRNISGLNIFSFYILIYRVNRTPTGDNVLKLVNRDSIKRNTQVKHPRRGINRGGGMGGEIR